VSTFDRKVKGSLNRAKNKINSFIFSFEVPLTFDRKVKDTHHIPNDNENIPFLSEIKS